MNAILRKQLFSKTYFQRKKEKNKKLNVLENGGSGKTFSEKIKSILGIF
jgi:hypothetical protein